GEVAPGGLSLLLRPACGVVLSHESLAVEPQLLAAGAVDVAGGAVADGHRNPSWGADWQAFIHRSWDGCGDWGNGRCGRGCDALSGRDAGRNGQGTRQAAPHAS